MALHLLPKISAVVRLPNYLVNVTVEVQLKVITLHDFSRHVINDIFFPVDGISFAVTPALTVARHCAMRRGTDRIASIRNAAAEKRQQRRQCQYVSHFLLP